MNGRPIPLAHGGPLRLIVPVYTGVKNIKYIKRLAFTAQQTDAVIQKTGYRISPPGDKGNPSQSSVSEMGPNSWINSPAPDSGTTQAGMVQIKGVAFGGMNAVKSVDVPSMAARARSRPDWSARISAAMHGASSSCRSDWRPAAR